MEDAQRSAVASNRKIYPGTVMVSAMISKKELHSVAQLAGVEIVRLRDKIVNSYLVAGEDNSWAIVDAGMSAGHFKKIQRAAEHYFGVDEKPSAIFLTHGHFDHVGALDELLRRWNVPVYAHELEMPFLTGQSDYPPPDPTVGGGMMARMSPLFPRKALHLGDRIQPLPEDGSLPHLPGWRWIHTPGHTAGHVSFFRDNDRTLIAGDAFVTVKNESAFAVLLQKQKVSRPPAYFTTDWEQARRSVEILADLRPEIAATGHGIPMAGEVLRHELDRLARDFSELMPNHGRYVQHPAISDANGVQFIPPKVSDPMPKVLGAIALLGVSAMVVRKMRGKSKRKRAHA